VLQTPFCRALGIEHPILSVGFAASAGPALAAAVSNAGACGVLGSGGLSVNSLRARIRETRALTSRAFGVNVVLEITRDGIVEACIEEAVPLLVLFWGDPAAWVADAHRGGTKVLIQVGSVKEAVAAAEAGVDGVIAQGSEAGGHIRGSSALTTVLPAIVQAVAPLPVLASGGIATGSGIIAALALGGQGVSLGTVFVASDEADIALDYKRRIVQSGAEDTVYCEDLFDAGWPNAPHRVLRNEAVKRWEAAGRPALGQRSDEHMPIGTVLRNGRRVEVPRYAATMLTSDFEGDLDAAPLWAGESCGLVRTIRPAAQIVRDLVREADEALARLNASTKSC
jgi:NAD(P)H-dependent flavin oxidoreductase YrpB (nitropropane dioxygenase family)